MRQFRLINTPKGILNITEANLFEVGEEVVETGPVDSRPYKVYSAIFTQSGTAAPVVTVLENTFDGSLTWNRGSAGSYNLVSGSGEFTANKTVMFKHIEHAGLNRWIAGRRQSDTNFQVITYGNSVPTDGINGTDGFPTFIEVRVYN